MDRAREQPHHLQLFFRQPGIIGILRRRHQESESSESNSSAIAWLPMLLHILSPLAGGPSSINQLACFAHLLFHNKSKKEEI